MKTPTSNKRNNIPTSMENTFLYFETSAYSYGPNVYCSSRRRDFIQISDISFS